jgi:hypothetical protein
MSTTAGRSSTPCGPAVLESARTCADGVDGRSTLVARAAMSGAFAPQLALTTSCPGAVETEKNVVLVADGRESNVERSMMRTRH